VADKSFLVDAAPKPVGAYPHARWVGDLLFLSGVGPRSPQGGDIPGVTLDQHGQIIAHDIALQTHAVLHNVRTILEASGAQWRDLVDITVFLTDMRQDFDTFNRVYASYFSAQPPTRTTLEICALPTPIAIELKCIAAPGSGAKR